MWITLGVVVYLVVGVLNTVMLMKQNPWYCRDYNEGPIETVGMFFSILLWPITVAALVMDSVMRGLARLFNL